MKSYLYLLLILVISYYDVNAQQIDEQKSTVTFEISNMKFKTVEGSFTGMSGTINFNENDLSNATFNVCIDAKSVNTANEKRDEHLRKEDFFHVEKHPSICFVSSAVSKTNNGFLAKGDLTLHGVTKSIEIPFVKNDNSLSGNLTINRIDYQIGEDGTFMIGNEVSLTINCVLK